MSLYETLSTLHKDFLSFHILSVRNGLIPLCPQLESFFILMWQWGLHAANPPIVRRMAVDIVLPVKLLWFQDWSYNLINIVVELKTFLFRKEVPSSVGDIEEHRLRRGFCVIVEVIGVFVLEDDVDKEGRKAFVRVEFGSLFRDRAFFFLGQYTFNGDDVPTRHRKIQLGWYKLNNCLI